MDDLLDQKSRFSIPWFHSDTWLLPPKSGHPLLHIRDVSTVSARITAEWPLGYGLQKIQFCLLPLPLAFFPGIFSGNAHRQQPGLHPPAGSPAPDGRPRRRPVAYTFHWSIA